MPELLTRLCASQPAGFCFSREAAANPQTANTDARTIDITLSTGARGTRVPWMGDAYDEELAIDEKAVRLARINNHAPFLDMHRSSRDIGKFVPGSVRVEDGAVVGSVQFYPKDQLSADDELIVQRILTGNRRNISVGYNVHQWQRTKAKDRKDGGELDIYRAIDWEPFEGSSVTMGFDDMAMTRGAQGAPMRADTPHNNTEEKMSVNTQAPDDTGTRTAAQQAETEAAIGRAKEEAEEAATKRASEIYARAAQFGLGNDYAEKLVAERKLSLTDAYRKMADELATRKTEETKGLNPSFRSDGEQEKKRTDAIREAMANRLSGGRVKLSDGNHYRSYSMIDFARELGIGRDIGSRENHRVAALMLKRGAGMGMATTDLPTIFGGALNISIVALGEAEPLTFTPFCREGQLDDFRTKYPVKLGSQARFTESPQGKDYDFSAAIEEGEGYAAKKYATGLSWTYEMIVNDNWEALQALITDTIIDWRATQNDIIYGSVDGKIPGLLRGNKKLVSDSKALFHTDHKNIATAYAAIDFAAIQAANKALGKQTSLSGRAMNMGTHCIVTQKGSADELAVAQIISGLSGAMEPGKVVPQTWRAYLHATDQRVPDNTVYFFANPLRAPVIEYSYLAGQSEPRMEMLECSEMVGMRYGFYGVFGAGLVDYRGVYRNSTP